MDNLETRAFGTRDTGRRQKKQIKHNTAQKTKKMSNTDPTKTLEWQTHVLK
jgi:hypothetical protein